MSAVAIAIIFAFVAQTPEYRVIVHPSNPAAEIDRRMLADMFMKKTSTWPGGQAVAPVDLLPKSPLREKFAEGVLNRSVAAIKSYWQQRIFSGRGVPPPELDSEDAVVRF